MALLTRCGYPLITSTENTKYCKKCACIKPLIAFPKNSKGKYGRGQSCNKCSATITAEYLKQNYTKVYASKFNTTEDVVEKVLSKKVCDICGKEPRLTKRHSIDHCHTTGKIRGLLCDDCNTALGKFQDNTTLLKKAIEYLENS